MCVYIYIYIARIQIYIWTLILLYILWTHLYTFNGGIAPVTSREINEAKVWELLHSPIVQVIEWSGSSQARQEQCPIHDLPGWNPACCWCWGAPSEAAWLAAGLPTSQPSHRERWYFLHKPHLLFPRPGYWKLSLPPSTLAALFELSCYARRYIGQDLQAVVNWLALLNSVIK